MAKLDQIIITDVSGAQTLIDLWDSGVVEVSWREAAFEGWMPSETIGMAVRVLRNVQ